MVVATRSLFERLFELLVRGEPKGDIDRIFSSDVQGWSPMLSVTSTKELEKILAERLDALDNIDHAVDGFDVVGVGNKMIAEWHLEADHTGLLSVGPYSFEQTGRRLTLNGASFVELDSGRIVAFRNYFDDAALLEQLFEFEVES